MPLRTLYRLVPLRSEVLQGQGPNQELGDELQVRDKDLQDVPLVCVLRVPETAVSVGRMTLVNIFVQIVYLPYICFKRWTNLP